jgi:hypothetical protein
VEATRSDRAAIECRSFLPSAVDEVVGARRFKKAGGERRRVFRPRAISIVIRLFRPI